MKLSTKVARQTALALFFAAALLPGKTHAAQNQQQAAADAAQADSAATLFPLDDDDTIRNNTANPNVAADEVSIAKPHWLVLWLPAPLPSDHRISMAIKDAKGSSVTNWNFLYKAENAYKFIYFEVHPSFKTNAPGKWFATSEIKGVGNFKAQYTVLAATPAENAKFQLYEQGAEEARSAVVHYWMAYKGSYFAYLGKDLLIQVRDLLPWWRKANLSKADELNGLAYRGYVSFSFDTYRTYSATNGWTKWYDIKPRSETTDNPMANLIAASFAQFIPETTKRILYEPDQQIKFRQSLALNYSFEQRDGNWFVQPGRPKMNDDGKAYALRPANKDDDDNSESTEPTKNDPFAGAMGESYWMLDPYARFANGKQVAGDPATPPPLALVKQALEESDPARVRDALLGKQVRESPEELKQNMISTMKELRGHSLY